MYRKLRVLQTGESSYIIQAKAWFFWKNLDGHGAVANVFYLDDAIVGDRTMVYSGRSEAIKSARLFALESLSKSKFTPKVIWHT